MGTDLEVDEGYFLLRYTRNCKQRGQGECMAWLKAKFLPFKCGLGVCTKTSMFLLRVRHLSFCKKAY